MYGIQVTKRSLGLHTTIAELVKEVIDEVAFSELKSQEQRFLEEVDHDKVSDYIEKLIGRQGDIKCILRLICLQSQVGWLLGCLECGYWVWYRFATDSNQRYLSTTREKWYTLTAYNT